ncbi:hypothetical protein K503DRAFT_777994, partial [Rhizopogon vinicolor AM-OR11-026]
MVNRWRRIFDESGTFKKPPSPLVRCTQIITRALMTAAEDLFSEDSDRFLDEVYTCSCSSLGISYRLTRATTSLSDVPLLFILNDLYLVIFP